MVERLHTPLNRPHLLRTAVLGALAGLTALVSGGMPASGAPGTAWSATVVVQNLADTPNEAAVSYYSTTGVLMKTFPLGGIPPKGTAYLDASQVGELPANFAGGAVVSSAQPVAVAYVGSDTGAPAARNHLAGPAQSTGLATSWLPEIHNRYADKLSTIVVQNPQTTALGVTLRFVERFSGSLTATLQQVVPPNATHYYDAANLPARVDLPAGWTGSVIVQTDGPPAVVAVQQRTLSSDQSTLYTAVESGTATWLPEVLYEYGDIRLNSFIRLQNVGDTTLNARVTYFNDNGDAVAAQDVGLAPLQTQVVIAGGAGLPPGFRGAAQVQATGSIAAVVRHSSAVNDLDVTYSPPARDTQRAALPYVQWAPTGNPAAYRTTVAVMNTLPAPATITVRYYDPNGALRAAPSATVPPNGVFRSDPNAFAGDGYFMGSVEVETNGGMAVLASALTIDGARGEAYPAIRTR